MPGIERVIAYRAGFFPDGKPIWFVGAEPSSSNRTYTQNIDGGDLRAATPEGVFAAGVSPDGKSLVAPGPDGRITLFPVDGGAPHVLPGLEPGLLFVQWGADGRSIYVRDDEQPTSVYRTDLSTGQKTLVLRLIPSDRSGVVNLQTVVLSPNAKAYAYNYRRILSELLVVKGLKWASRWGTVVDAGQKSAWRKCAVTERSLRSDVLEEGLGQCNKRMLLGTLCPVQLGCDTG